MIPEGLDITPWIQAHYRKAMEEIEAELQLCTEEERETYTHTSFVDCNGDKFLWDVEKEEWEEIATKLPDKPFAVTPAGLKYHYIPDSGAYHDYRIAYCGARPSEALEEYHPDTDPALVCQRCLAAERRE